MSRGFSRNLQFYRKPIEEPELSEAITFYETLVAKLERSAEGKLGACTLKKAEAAFMLRVLREGVTPNG